MPTLKKLKDSLKLLTLKEIGPIKFATSGFTEIDEVTGGFPRGRITEIHGKQGVGKTSLVLKCLAEVSQKHKVLFIDAENALNPERLIDFGAKMTNIAISNEASLEIVAEYTVAAVKDYDVIVVDSISSLIPKVEDEGEVGDANVGLRARRMGAWVRKLVPKLGKSKCAFVFINQLRDSMSMYGDPTFTPGGHAVPYAASLRLRLSTTRAERKDNGHNVVFEVVKSKVSAPYKKGKFYLEYNPKGEE